MYYKVNSTALDWLPEGATIESTFSETDRGLQAESLLSTHQDWIRLQFLWTGHLQWCPALFSNGYLPVYTGAINIDQWFMSVSCNMNLHQHLDESLSMSVPKMTRMILLTIQRSREWHGSSRWGVNMTKGECKLLASGYETNGQKSSLRYRAV